MFPFDLPEKDVDIYLEIPDKLKEKEVVSIVSNKLFELSTSKNYDISNIFDDSNKNNVIFDNSKIKTGNASEAIFWKMMGYMGNIPIDGAKITYNYLTTIIFYNEIKLAWCFLKENKLIHNLYESFQNLDDFSWNWIFFCPYFLDLRYEIF